MRLFNNALTSVAFFVPMSNQMYMLSVYTYLFVHFPNSMFGSAETKVLAKYKADRGHIASRTSQVFIEYLS